MLGSQKETSASTSRAFNASVKPRAISTSCSDKDAHLGRLTVTSRSEALQARRFCFEIAVCRPLSQSAKSRSERRLGTAGWDAYPSPLVTVPASSTWVPETRYARNGDVHIAYQVFGEGDVTFVGLPGIISNIEGTWEDPRLGGGSPALRRFAASSPSTSAARVCLDRDTGVPTLDERLGDLAAVLDAVGTDRVALAGVSEGGSTAAMFAATYPERTSHLLLFGSFARVDVERGDAFMPRWAASWGTRRL